MPHIDFLEMVLAEAWDDTAAVNYDRATWAELTTLRFVDENYNALILGPVEVGKTFPCHRPLPHRLSASLPGSLRACEQDVHATPEDHHSQFGDAWRVLDALPVGAGP